MIFLQLPRPLYTLIKILKKSDTHKSECERFLKRNFSIIKTGVKPDRSISLRFAPYRLRYWDIATIKDCMFLFLDTWTRTFTYKKIHEHSHIGLINQTLVSTMSDVQCTILLNSFDFEKVEMIQMNWMLINTFRSNRNWAKITPAEHINIRNFFYLRDRRSFKVTETRMWSLITDRSQIYCEDFIIYSRWWIHCHGDIFGVFKF